CDQEPAGAGQLAHEELEYGRFRLPVIQIGLDHVHLIKIGEQRGSRQIHSTSSSGHGLFITSVEVDRRGRATSIPSLLPPTQQDLREGMGSPRARRGSDQAFLISIFFSALTASGLFCAVIVRTPLSNFASI